ncbi:MAG: hypothetical protein OXI53_07085 [Nitrospira sp.]|nr:hypothetical protein [Nitrospira sp.]
MRSLRFIFGASLAIGAFWAPVTHAETFLEILKKDPLYQALPPDQQKQVADELLEHALDRFTSLQIANRCPSW